MSAFKISPVRGSLMCGPLAFSVVDGSQRITEWRTSSGLHEGSCAAVGISFPTMAFLKPAAANASFQSSMPFFSLDILRERVDVFDKGAGGVHAGRAQLLAGTELLQIAGEQARHFDHWSAVLRERRHRERLDYRFVIRILHGHRDRLIGIRRDAV